MKTRHSKQVLVGLSGFSDGVLHFLQIKKKLYIFYRNYLVALIEMFNRDVSFASSTHVSVHIIRFINYTILYNSEHHLKPQDSFGI